MYVFGQSDIIRAKVIVFGKVVVFWQRLFYSDKSGCNRAKWLYSDKKDCFREKVVVFSKVFEFR